MDKSEFERLTDCCRPGADDLADKDLSALADAMQQDPQLRPVWQSQQAWNRAMGQAMQDVPVPQGLSDRILARLADPADIDAQPGAAPVQVASPVGGRHWNWRYLAAAAATVAAILCVVVWLRPWAGSISGVEFASMARTWLEQLDPEGWRSDQLPIEQYPLDPALHSALHSRLVAWQTFEALGDASAVAYVAEMPPDRANVYLLVIRTRRGDQLPDIPPPNPDSTTGGVCLGVWQNGGRVYVLAVPGSQQRYQRMINSQSFVQSQQFFDFGSRG